MEVGLSILLQLVDNGVVNNLEFNFFCLLLLLNFKSYFLMSSKIITEDMLKSSASESELLVSVVISNYPLSNGGYLVSFGHDDREGVFKNYDPVMGSIFEDSLLSKHLDCNPLFLPAGCFYLPESGLASFIESLAFGASFFEMKLLPASAQMQSLLLVKVNELSLFKYEQKEEDKR